MHGDAARAARRERLAPVRLRGGELEHAAVARMLGEKRTAQLERVLLRLARDLIKKAFGGEGGVRGAHGAPPLHGHADLRRMQVHGEVGDVVGEVRGALDRSDVEAVLDHYALEGGAGEDRLADDGVLPRDDLAARVEARL